MCSSDYYFEIHRKSLEFEQHFENPCRVVEEEKENEIQNETAENSNTESILTDYEVVNNEDFDTAEEEDIEETRNTFAQPNFETFRKFAPKNDKVAESKLRLSLSAEKIALKSQITKIDKSITPQETETGRNNVRKQCSRGEATTTATIRKTLCQRHRREQHVPAAPQPPVAPPSAFSIVPLNQVPPTQQAATNDGKNLPEIVLTSYRTPATAKPKKSPAKKPATVTFQATAIITNEQQREQQHQQQQLQQHVAAAKLHSPPPPPPPAEGGSCRRSGAPNKYASFGAKSIEAEVYDKLLRADNAEEESSGENNSQRGAEGSTSPESLIDLSAASVSVRSSSLSSGGTEMSKYGLGAPHMAAGGGTSSSSSSLMSHVALSALVRETHANRSLNSKASELKVLSPIPPTPTPIAMPLPMPVLVPSTSSLLHALSPSTAAVGIGGGGGGGAVSASPSRASMNETQTLLQLPAALRNEVLANRSRSSSPSPSITIRVTQDATLFPEDLKCQICAEVYRDPRTLNCLHSFCFQCIVDENFKQDSSIPFWSQPADPNAITHAGEDNDWKAANKTSFSLRSSSPEMSLRSESTSPSRTRRTSFSFIRKKSLDRILLKPRQDTKSSDSSSSTRLNNNADERLRIIICKTCKYTTELPIGGIRQLPQNFLLVRKIEDIKSKVGDEVIARVWCSLCFEENNATYHCITCALNLCTLCKEAHERQRNTAAHKIKNITDLRKARKQKQNMFGDNTKFTLKCGMHPGFEMKSFCNTCLQVACADCLVLLHKGHKHELIGKAINSYAKILRESIEQMRPLCNYAEHSIERLNEIAKRINNKCDEVQAEVDKFIQQYFEAVEVHRKTLLQQIHRARESKVEMILEQQLDMEKRNNDALDAMRFSQDLTELGSDVEILAFLNIVLKRFEFCQQFKMPVDPKISDSLHFLPEIRAPTTKAQYDIPLFGIITMQMVEPSLCTLQVDPLQQLRLHKKVELLMLSRDADGAALCHGGLQIHAVLKYKDPNSKFLPVEIADNRDGTYSIAFTPDSQGTLLLTVTINDKPIKGTPFTFLARTVRPHTGTFHCCAFCSSKGSKLAKCMCEGRMPGYHGCGHGHPGHPGSRHWSCCGNVLENSECNVANKLLSS